MKITKELPVQLDEELMATLGREVAKRVRENADLKEEKKKQNAGINLKIKEVTEIIRKTSEQIATGTAMREVQCTVVKDLETKTVTVTRDDTGEVIEERPMTAEELQLTILDPRKKKRVSGDKLPGMGSDGGTTDSVEKRE